MKNNTMLLIVVAATAAAGIYFLTRPKTVAPGINPTTGLPYQTYPPAYNPYAPVSQQNQTAQDIAAGGVAAGGIADIINAFNNSN